MAYRMFNDFAYRVYWFV